MMEQKDTDEVFLTEHRAMICIPEDTVEVEIIAKVYHDGELHEVSKVMDMSAVRMAFQKADDGYIDDEDRFVLTDKGRAFLEEIE